MRRRRDQRLPGTTTGTGPPSSACADPSAYFNTGVLLMNLDLMRRDGCTEALLECARSHATSSSGPTRTR